MKSEQEIRQKIERLEEARGLTAHNEYYLNALYWTLGLCRVGKSTFSYCTRGDGKNEIWDLVRKEYPPNKNGVSIVPLQLKIGNSSFDFETESVCVVAPLKAVFENVILHVRE